MGKALQMMLPSQQTLGMLASGLQRVEQRVHEESAHARQSQLVAADARALAQVLHWLLSGMWNEPSCVLCTQTATYSHAHIHDCIPLLVGNSYFQCCLKCSALWRIKHCLFRFSWPAAHCTYLQLRLLCRLFTIGWTNWSA